MLRIYLLSYNFPNIFVGSTKKNRVFTILDTSRKKIRFSLGNSKTSTKLLLTGYKGFYLIDSQTNSHNQARRAIIPGLNRVQLIGRLRKDPETRFTPKGSKVCSITVAVDRRWKPEGDTIEATDWFNIETWGKLGENC